MADDTRTVRNLSTPESLATCARCAYRFRVAAAVRTALQCPHCSALTAYGRARARVLLAQPDREDCE